MRIARSPFSFPQSKYAPSSGRQAFGCGCCLQGTRKARKEPTAASRWRASPTVRLPGLTADQAAGRIAAWFEAGLDTAALLFFPLLVLVPRSIAPLVSAAGLCAAGLVVSARGFGP